MEEAALTHSRLREMVDYDPETGVFTWREQIAKCIRIGNVCGRINAKGYRQIQISGRLYQAHRLVWLWMTGGWPPTSLDHRNGQKDDNRFANLRLATSSQNGANRRLPQHNTSGYRGVTKHTQTGKWQSQIGVAGRSIHLGLYADAVDAARAYNKAAAEAFGEYAVFNDVAAA